MLCLEHVVARDPSVNEVAGMCTDHAAHRPSPDAHWTIEDETPGNIRRVIAECGWWVGLIASDEGEPSFAYTIGLWETLGTLSEVGTSTSCVEPIGIRPH